MISDNFKLVNPSMTDLMCAFDNSLGNIAILTILLSIAIVMGIAIYSWNRDDAIGSFLYGFSSMSIIGFLLTLTSSTVCVRLLSYNKFTTLLVITTLLFISKKVMD